METILLGAAALACPVGMGLMMWFMAKGMRRKDAAPGEPMGLDELRTEHDRLGAEIERLESANEPVAHREALR